MVLGDEMVSIIVPVYKVEEYLPRCINSLINQTYKNIEIILVDDGSPDNCPKICDEYAQKDNRIKVIHKQNGGLSSARNEGIKEAKGEFISFVDSDDWVDPKFISCLHEIIVSNNADFSSCLFCRTTGEQDRKLFSETEEIITDKKFICAMDEKFYTGYAWNKMYKRSIIVDNEIFFDESIFNGEDFPFVFEYLEYVNRGVFIRQDLYFYFIRQTSIMHTVKISERYLTILKAREKGLSILKTKCKTAYDMCLAAYLDQLCKIKFMIMKDLDCKELLHSVNQKIKTNKKGLMGFKNVSLKSKIRLLLMIYFPKMVRVFYLRKIGG